MKLTAQTFQAVVCSIRAQLPSGRERAAYNQIQGKARIVVVRAGGVTDPVSVDVTDLTPTGISLVHSRAMKAGDRFLLLIKNEAKGASAVLYTVARWHPIGEKIFVIAATFTRELHTAGMSEESLSNPARFCSLDEMADTVDVDHVRQVEEQLRAWPREGLRNLFAAGRNADWPRIDTNEHE